MFADEFKRLEEHIESIKENGIICYVRSNEYELNEVKQDIVSSCVENVKVTDNVLYINGNAKIYFYTTNELSENVFMLKNLKLIIFDYVNLKLYSHKDRYRIMNDIKLPKELNEVINKKRESNLKVKIEISIRSFVDVSGVTSALGSAQFSRDHCLMYTSHLVSDLVTDIQEETFNKLINEREKYENTTEED